MSTKKKSSASNSPTGTAMPSPKSNCALKGKNTLVVITGASKGIGRTLAKKLCSVLTETDSAFVLISRNTSALEELKKEILRDTLSTTVEVLPIDLAEPIKPIPIEQTIKNLEQKTNFVNRIIIHNAGSLGDLSKKAGDAGWDEAQWHEYLQTNLVSMVALNSRIFSALKKDPDTTTFVVNLTSLLAITAFPSFTQYSVAKAAREAYFRHPECRVLSYAPGPVETEMHVEVSQKSYDSEVREMFAKKHEKTDLQRKVLTPEETVEKLVGILKRNEFESGARIDFFDDDKLETYADFPLSE